MIGKIITQITRDTMTISCRAKLILGVLYKVKKTLLCRPYQPVCPPVTYYQKLNILWIFKKFPVLVIYKQLSS
jgi:hypothetical protein